MYRINIIFEDDELSSTEYTYNDDTVVNGNLTTNEITNFITEIRSVYGDVKKVVLITDNDLGIKQLKLKSDLIKYSEVFNPVYISSNMPDIFSSIETQITLIETDINNL